MPRAFYLACCIAAAGLTLSGCDRRSGDGPLVVSAIGSPPRPVSPSALDDGTPNRLLIAATAQGLVRIDAAGQVEPGVADRWTVMDNGLSYIFRIADLRWSDGKPVTSEQVVTILKRAVAADRSAESGGYMAAVDQITAMTPEVIEIDLARPRTDFLRRLAQPEMALFRLNPPGGTGPMRLAGIRPYSVVLRPVAPAHDDDDDTAAKPSPRDDVTLIGERAALAITRFADHRSDVVLGGTVADWPLVAGVDIPASSIHRDPAEGLFGLAIVNRDGFLATPTARAAVAAAIDRQALVMGIAPDWPSRETILPEALDSAATPTIPAWSSGSLDQRREAARLLTASWRATHVAPLTLRIALPTGPGGTLLFGAIGAAMRSIGIEPVRVGFDKPADLRLIDAVAPFDTARWYLSTACVACSDDARAAIEAARLAGNAAERGPALAKADVALTNDVAFIPLATPLRWALVSPGVDLWQANARAWHPLNEQRSPTT